MPGMAGPSLPALLLEDVTGRLNTEDDMTFCEVRLRSCHADDAPGSAQSNDSQSSSDAGWSVPGGSSPLGPAPETPPPCAPGPPNSKSASSIWSDVFSTEAFLPPAAAGSSSSLPSGCVVFDRCRRFWNHTWLG